MKESIGGLAKFRAKFILNSKANFLIPIFVFLCIPELLELIQSNQDDFIRLINEPDSAAAAPGGESGQGGPAGGAGGLSEDMPGVISVSQQDKEAIDRVSAYK